MTKSFDPVALKVGAAYKRGRDSLIEAGKLLAGVKRTLKHGEWENWIRTNADALGFRDPCTASRLMKLAANPASTQDLWDNGNRGGSTQFLFTSPKYIRLVKDVFGGAIDIDPSSCREANDKYVKAKTFYTKEQDGLKRQWIGRVYLNPMYDSIPPFVDKLIAEIDNGNCKEAIPLVPTSRFGLPCFREAFKRSSSICLPHEFVPFHAPKTGKTGQPSYCVFMYFGPNDEKFATAFREVGTVVKAIRQV